MPRRQLKGRGEKGMASDMRPRGSIHRKERQIVDEENKT